MKGCYLWIPKKGAISGRGYPGPISVHTMAIAFYPWHVVPKFLWSLVDYTDPAAPPEIEDNDLFRARVNCFRETLGDDYDQYEGSSTLYYHSRFTDGGHWALLEL